MGNYPKCYTVIDENKNPSFICDPRVYKVNDRLIRSAKKAKTASKTNHELNLLKLEMAVLNAIVHLPEEDKEEALDELEEALDGTELEEERKEDIEDKPKKKKFDDPEDALIRSTRDNATIEPKFSALEYKVGSLGFEPVGENGDKLMKRIVEGVFDSEQGDDFLMELGAS